MREASLVSALVVAAVYLAGCATTIEPNLYYSVQTRKSLQDTEARPAAPLAENSLDIFVYGVSTEVQVYQPKNFLGGGGLVATGQIINNDQFANTPITEFEAADFLGYGKYRSAILNITIVGGAGLNHRASRFNVFLFPGNGIASESGLFAKGRFLGEIGYYVPLERLTGFGVTNMGPLINQSNIDISDYLRESLEAGARYVGVRFEPIGEIENSWVYAESIVLQR